MTNEVLNKLMIVCTTIALLTGCTSQQISSITSLSTEPTVESSMIKTPIKCGIKK